jgi:hypothetical protein
MNNKIELADILKNHLNDLKYIGAYDMKVVNNIIACRTAALGGHLLKCDYCNHIEISYNSCRDRNCPKCQAIKKLKWIENREKELLPVPYFHIVFTIPDTLHDLFIYNKSVCYNLLFKAVKYSFEKASKKETNLGAQLGFISILHTWDQKLNFHPHIHCIVPAGGLSFDHQKWIHCKSNFFISVKILSTLFQAILIRLIEKANTKNLFQFFGKIGYLKNNRSFKKLLIASVKSKWVVYAKKPFGGPAQVFNYLGHYTHRVGISNNRILCLKDSKVTFLWKDRRKKNKTKKLVIDSLLFAKRFILHILPKGFMKIRYYGFLGNKVKKELIPLCRKLIEKSEAITTCSEQQMTILQNKVEDILRQISICPVCGKGYLELFTSIQYQTFERKYEHMEVIPNG